MALLTPPAFQGKITVTTGVNDKLYWREDGPFDLSITISAGNHWPDALADLLTDGMNTASSSSGASNTYTWNFAIDTGLAACARATGSADFYLKSTTSETDNILRGGDDDTQGNALATDQHGLNGLGWLVESGYPSLGSSVEAADHYSNWFTPEYPPSADDDGVEFESTAAQVFALDGTPTTYDFTGWDDSTSEYPLYGGLFRKRTIEMQEVSTTYKELWIYNFWGPYGKAGKTFRYYPDRSAGSYELHVLTGDSILHHGLSQRQHQNAWWSGSVEMHRVSS